MSSLPNNLSRKLGLMDATTVGLSAMIGAGIFAALGPAASVAGTGLLVGVCIAGCIAFLNATSMAQLAARYPESGGTYIYGRKQLNSFLGFIAGWGFIIGKTSSCAAMAMTFGYYISPEYGRIFAMGAVFLLTTVNYMGIQKTATVTKVITAHVLIALSIFVLTGLMSPTVSDLNLRGWTQVGGWYGILQSAGLLFFAFAGYARVATLGEEVVDPKKNIPKAIIRALSITIVLYLVIMTVALLNQNVSIIAQSKAPLYDIMRLSSFSNWSWVIRLGAILGCLGVLLSLLAGISRTVLAMARHNDLPAFLSQVHPTRRIPHYAEFLVGAVVIAVVGVVDLKSAIGFSSFSILTYYGIANVSALSLSPRDRLWPKWMSALGFCLCVIIALCLPLKSIFFGFGIFSSGILYYVVTKKNSYKY